MIQLKTESRRRLLRLVWHEMKETVDVNAVQDYNVKGTFSANSAINHPKFGLGIVTESLHSKIEVVFKEGPKSLVQNRE